MVMIRERAHAPGLMDRIGRAWQRMLRRRAEQSELEGCGCAEIERMAHDLGVTGEELRALAGHDAELLWRRMEALNLDPSKVDPALLRDLERTCSACESGRQCEHDLDTRPQAANWPEYCPNSATLEALKANKCR